MNNHITRSVTRIRHWRGSPVLAGVRSLEVIRINLNFREASGSDVPALVQLLADDVLGARRDG